MPTFLPHESFGKDPELKDRYDWTGPEQSKEQRAITETKQSLMLIMAIRTASKTELRIGLVRLMKMRE